MKIIERPEYLDRLKGLRNTPDIKIITGIRRSGKSELMRAYMDYIREVDDKSNIIYIDFYNLEYEHLKDYGKMHNHIQSWFRDGMNNYLFIDEVQLCPHFELAINSLHNSGKYDIYITGSNAFLLSSDLTTLFTGRFIEIPVYPFGLAEYCRYYGIDNVTRKVLDEYMVKGGLPGSYVYTKEIDRIAYVKDVYKTIVNRDLVAKYRITDEKVLELLTKFLMDNISNLTSPNKIADSLTANSYPTNHVKIGNYINYLCNAFMFYDTKRYDIKGSKYLKSSEKFYLNDLGMRYAILGTRNLDYGRAYENMVSMELRRRGYEIYVGKLYQKEIDFVAIRGSEKLYIQVSDNISEESTLTREVTPLLQIRDAYPKILLANTEHPEYQYKGVRIINLADWLVG